MSTDLVKRKEGSNESTSFVIDKDDFADLVFNPAMQKQLWHIFNKAKQQPVKEFVLAERPRVKYLCHVTLVETQDKFTPRLAFSIRDETGTLRTQRVAAGAETYDLKARIDLQELPRQILETGRFP